MIQPNFVLPQQMSDLEKERRQRTNTLSSGGLVTNALKMLSAACDHPDGIVSNLTRCLAEDS